MEYWDVYNEDRQLTGKVMERDCWEMKPGEYHITVLALVMSTEGKILITRRALDKPWAAGHWEIPGGAVLAGETPEEAVLREVREETGLPVSASSAEVIYSYRRDNPEEKNNYFVDIYGFTVSFSLADVRLQAEETIDARLADLSEIKELGEAGVFLHYKSLQPALESAAKKLSTASREA